MLECVENQTMGSTARTGRSDHEIEEAIVGTSVGDLEEIGKIATSQKAFHATHAFDYSIPVFLSCKIFRFCGEVTFVTLQLK